MKRILRWVVTPLVLAVSLVLSALVLGRRAFDRLVRSDVQDLIDRPTSVRSTVVTEDMLGDLPQPVQHYLCYTGVVGKPIPRTVRLRQRGTMRLAAGQPELPLDAEQYYTVQPPGFVWDGTVHLGPFPLARARDMYREGAGNMLIKAGSFATVADVSGPEMDQGAMMRHLSEMIWFPAAFLADNISFEPVDDTSARITLTDQGRSVSGTMHFDSEGRLAGFESQRYRMVDGDYELDTWWTPVLEYGEFEGLKLPVRGKAVWKLPDGDLEYIDITITELEYDPA